MTPENISYNCAQQQCSYEVLHYTGLTLNDCDACSRQVKTARGQPAPPYTAGTKRQQHIVFTVPHIIRSESDLSVNVPLLPTFSPQGHLAYARSRPMQSP